MLGAVVGNGHVDDRRAFVCRATHGFQPGKFAGTSLRGNPLALFRVPISCSSLGSARMPGGAPNGPIPILAGLWIGNVTDECPILSVAKLLPSSKICWVV